jgi:thioredoxin reductase (NADPH)
LTWLQTVITFFFMDARIAIVGAGPIGLELAIALKQQKISYIQFDAQQIGYTISWFAPQTRFFSSNERIAIADVPLQTSDQLKATREEYLTYLRRVVQQFDLTIRTYETITEIRKEKSLFHLTTQSAAGTKSYVVEKVILATGGTAKANLLGIPGENLPHVSHYFQDPHQYFRKKLLIVGGKNSAVEAAVRCYHAGAEVAIAYRGKQFPTSIKYWLLPEINGMIESRRVAAYFQTRIISITPTHATLEDESAKRFDVPADFVLLMTGYVADMSLFAKAGVHLDSDRQTPEFDERTMETNVPGIYVAGTAIAGTQERYAIFLENCHIHVKKILAALNDQPAPEQTETFQRPES